MRISSLYRYPIKGLSPERLTEAHLVPGDYFPGDRLYALENGPSGYDPSRPAHEPKIKFLMLMRNAALAGLATRFEPGERLLVIARDGKEVARGRLDAADGRAAIEAFMTSFLGEEIRGPVRMLEAAQNFRFTDSKSGFVSFVNLASVAAIEQAEGRPVDPLRFRANIYLDGLEAWAETALVGRTLRFGGATLEILKMTDRCAATGVEPGTGRRDMDLVQTLRKNFGHVDCGVYARVVEGGRVAAGDAGREI
jgi:uncharacterized protein